MVKIVSEVQVFVYFECAQGTVEMNLAHWTHKVMGALRYLNIR